MYLLSFSHENIEFVWLGIKKICLFLFWLKCIPKKLYIAPLSVVSH